MAIILMGKRELVALLNLSSWCLVMVERLFLMVPRGCLRFVIVVFPDHTHLLFLALLYVMFSCVFVTFPGGVLVLDCIVLIAYFCLLPYFVDFFSNTTLYLATKFSILAL